MRFTWRGLFMLLALAFIATGCAQKDPVWQAKQEAQQRNLQAITILVQQQYVLHNGTDSIQLNGDDTASVTILGGKDSRSPVVIAARKVNDQWRLGCLDVDGAFVAFADTTKDAENVRIQFSDHHQCPSFRIGDPAPSTPKPDSAGR